MVANFTPDNEISEDSLNLASGLRTYPDAVNIKGRTHRWSIYNEQPRGMILDQKTGQLRDMTKTEKAERFLDEAVNGEYFSGPTLSGMNLNPNANIITTSS